MYRFGGRWYDSATGKWLSEDSAGFAAGDTNLDRYVGNDPTNAVDASGTEETKPDHRGKFQIKVGDRTVSPSVIVRSNVDFNDESGWIQIGVSTLNKIDVRLHWLQFVYTIRKDAKTRAIMSGGRILLADGRYLPYTGKDDYDKKRPARHVDGQDGKLFYDESAPGSTRWTPEGGVTIYDKPDVTSISEPKSEMSATDFKEIRSIFDAFLVDDSGKVYYHVHWERVGYYDGKEKEWTTKYENITWEPVKNNRLPADYFAREGQLRYGYESWNKDKKQLENPILKPFPPAKE